MGLCRSCLFVTAILFGILAYSIYVPPYEDYEEKIGIGIVLANLKLYSLLVSGATMLGYDDMLTRRTLMDFGLTVFPGKTLGSLEILWKCLDCYFHCEPGKLGPRICDIKSIWINYFNKVHDTTFDSVAVRVYRPVGEVKELPGVVFIHGGGWTSGSAKSYDRMARRLADDLKVVLVSVDYRLAPEFPFPIPFEDCVTATRYFMKNAVKHGVDPKRIAVAGDSAGGNLAAAVTLKLRDHSPPLKLQFLIYPTLQAIDFETPSFQINNNEILNIRKMMPVYTSNYVSGNYKYSDIMDRNAHTPLGIKETMAKTYLNHDMIPQEYRQSPYKRPKLEPGFDTVWNELKSILLNPYFSPLMAENLNNLPPAVIVTAGRDPLRDDGFMYSHRLKEAGNDVTHLNYPGSIHGFYLFFDMIGKYDKDIDEIDKIVKNLL